MQEAGTVDALWRYPVKSMRGERLDALRFGPAGAEGDRRWAVRDQATGRVLSAKRVPRLLEARALLGDGPVVELPPGSADLAALTGRDVALVEVPAEAERALIEGTGGGFESPPGTFFDAASVLVVTTATLNHLRALHPAGAIDARRFRPNLVVGTGDAVGPVEQAWIGGVVRAGEVALRIIRPCERCVVTTHAIDDLPVDRDVLRMINDALDGIVGVYAEVLTPGVLRAGDSVTISRSS